MIDGGSGDDVLSGTAGRDRIDGGRGSDVIHGLAGDDRLFGDAGSAAGSANDHDILFAGGGDDDLVGGRGTNELYAWTFDPTLGGQFGVFVDAAGQLVSNDGGGLFELENTGLNRMLGSSGDDELYGGTVLDFLYGGGGNDVLYDRTGSPLENSDGAVAGQDWKDYARQVQSVWYVAGSNADDVISVDFVTEPGVLAGRHLVTRLTNNNGNFTFAAQLRLDFGATNDDGSLVWDLGDSIFNFAALADANPLSRAAALDAFYQDADPDRLAGLLPPEDDFVAIIIDALDGNDQITVGPTVQKSVWVDAGAGDDTVEVIAGNTILTDQTESAGRVDSFGPGDNVGDLPVLAGPPTLVAPAAPGGFVLAGDATLHADDRRFAGGERDGSRGCDRRQRRTGRRQRHARRPGRRRERRAGGGRRGR